MLTYAMYVQIYSKYKINSLINMINIFTMHNTWSPRLPARKPIWD